jgi:hypothetical protein
MGSEPGRVDGVFARLYFTDSAAETGLVVRMTDGVRRSLPFREQ